MLAFPPVSIDNDYKDEMIDSQLTHNEIVQTSTSIKHDIIDARFCTAHGDGLKGGIAGKTYSFIIQV